MGRSVYARNFIQMLKTIYICCGKNVNSRKIATNVVSPAGGETTLVFYFITLGSQSIFVRTLPKQVQSPKTSCPGHRQLRSGSQSLLL